MTVLNISLYENERCRIIHQDSKAVIDTDGPIEWGGNGHSFSPTDLVAAALGSCILSILEPLFERNGFDPQKLELTIAKELSNKPMMIKSLKIDISFPDEVPELFKKKALKILEACPVKRSIHPDVKIDIHLYF